MYRRPNASWHEVDRGLIAPPGQVAALHAGVGMPRSLPPSLGFGSLNPSITTGSRFSGGAVPGPMNMVHPEMPQTFQPPSYGLGQSTQGRSIAPIIAALMSTGIGPGAGAQALGTSRVSAPANVPAVTAAARTALGTTPLSSGGPSPQAFLPQPRTAGNVAGTQLSGGLLAQLAQRGGLNRI
jgi:hypothetical protein